MRISDWSSYVCSSDLHLVDQEGDVAALAEHRGHDPGERDDPLEVFHGLGVDEDLERAALLVLAAEVEHDVVDRHVHGVFDQRRLDLVGAADQHFGALDALVHVDHFSRGQLRFGGLARDGRGCGSLVLVVGADDGVSGDFLFDLDGHDAVPGVRVCGAWCGWACCWRSGRRAGPSPQPLSRFAGEGLKLVTSFLRPCAGPSWPGLSSRPCAGWPFWLPCAVPPSSWPSSPTPSSQSCGARPSSPSSSRRPSSPGPSSRPCAGQPSSWPSLPSSSCWRPSCRRPSSSARRLRPGPRRWPRRATSSPWSRAWSRLSSPCWRSC